MKIVLRAFDGKLSGVMEIPEDTGPIFRLAMTQPVQMKKMDSRNSWPLMTGPLETICTFEWTGGTFVQEGHAWNNAREYQLTHIKSPKYD